MNSYKDNGIAVHLGEEILSGNTELHLPNGSDGARMHSKSFSLLDQVSCSQKMFRGLQGTAAYLDDINAIFDACSSGT